MKFIRQGATHKVCIGPVVAVGNGFTPVTTLSLASADEAEALVHDSGTVVDISGYTFAAVTTMDGYYNLTLQTGISNTVGHVTIAINDDSLCLPVKAEFTVVEEAVYDALFAASAAGYQVPIWAASNSTVNLSGTTIKTATDVETDTADIQSRLPAALGANGNMKADVRDYGGTAATTSGGRPEVNTKLIEGVDATDQLAEYTKLGAVFAIGTVNSQTSLDLTAVGGFAAVDDYTDYIAVIRDVSASSTNAVCFRRVTASIEATPGQPTITLNAAPFFTVTTSDKVELVPPDLEVLTRLPNATPAANGGLPTVNASNYVAGVQGTINTLDALDTAQDTQHSTTQSTLSTIAGYLDTEVAAILADTNELQTDWANGGRLDLLIDAIKAVTDLLTATNAEPTGVPAADATPLTKLATIYMMLRNKVTVTSTKKTYYDDGDAAEFEKDLSDDGTTYTESEVNSI